MKVNDNTDIKWYVSKEAVADVLTVPVFYLDHWRRLLSSSVACNHFYWLNIFSLAVLYLFCNIHSVLFLCREVNYILKNVTFQNINLITFWLSFQLYI